MNKLVIVLICLGVCLNNQNYFRGLTKQEFKEQYLSAEMADMSGIESEVHENMLSNDQLPENYNFFESHEKCRTVVRNQQSCGSYWAFSGAGVLANRFCK